MRHQALISSLKSRYGIETTREELRRVIGSLSDINESDIPLVASHIKGCSLEDLESKPQSSPSAIVQVFTEDVNLTKKFLANVRQESEQELLNAAQSEAMQYQQFKQDLVSTFTKKIALVGGLYDRVEVLEDQIDLTDPIDAVEESFQGERGLESVYSDALAQRLGGKREVPVPTGFIDVLTDTQVIEVKFAPCWKHAIGQVAMYGLYYPLHQKRIHLFGPLKDEQLKSIARWAAQAAIVVTHED